ncbi:MAG: hypothetical protein DME66_01355 [Verrucomicrobia bacterium]|nr:MAG: hypothetical protein DME66_01355 [Verrucomicrobiota bacterium]
MQYYGHRNAEANLILFSCPPQEGHRKSESSVIATAASDDRALPAKTFGPEKHQQQREIPLRDLMTCLLLLVLL